MLDDPDYTKILSLIAVCTSPDKLNNYIENAQRRNVPVIREAAIRQLASLVPTYELGTLEYDFWKVLTTYELVLREDGKTNVRLFKTREKVEIDGIENTLSEWAVQRLHQWAFDYLMANGMSDLTGENIILLHSDRFEPEVVEAARERLYLSGSRE